MIDPDILKKLVVEADSAAVENVREGRGGPFGASLNIINFETGHVMRIGQVSGNAVLETGVGSAHAEDQALSPENIRALKANLKNRDVAKIAVVVASSAESCPACHAKLEIIARILVEERLIQRGHFIVAYGATYGDTLNVAGFNDEAYHADMLKAPSARLIKIESVSMDRLPQAVQENLAYAPAVVQTDDVGLSNGRDERDVHFTFTPEITALRGACAVRRAKGAADPWDLHKATLYTTTAQIGPLAYAEAQWANVARFVLVTGDVTNVPDEAPQINNDDLFQAVAMRPYNNERSALQIVHIEPFDNLGQHEWAKLLAENPERLKTYNGVSA